MPGSGPPRATLAAAVDLNLSVLIDFDNIAKGTLEDGLGDFDARVIMRRLKDKGRILVARAYCDWDRWPKRHRLALSEQGVTMVELTSHAGSNKNRGDIALAVDAMELAYTRSFIDAYVIVSGDSDFTPLVMRLKELNRRVIGIGTRRATSRLIASICDEFLFYDTLLAPAPTESEDAGEPMSRDEAFALLVETIVNTQRDEAGAVASGIVKQAMKRKVPSFSEADLGFSSFGRFLEKAEEKKRIALLRDGRGGGYLVDLPSALAEPVTVAVAPAVESEPVRHTDPRRAALADAGLELPAPEDRLEVAEAFVDVCRERAGKGRKCAVQFVIGDLLNRNLRARADEVRGFVNSLFRANLLLHADGEPVRKPTSPFVSPEDPVALVAALEERERAVLEGAGFSVVAEDGERKPRRRGGRRGRGGRSLEAGEAGELVGDETFVAAEAEPQVVPEPDADVLAVQEPPPAPMPEGVEESAPTKKPRRRKKAEPEPVPVVEAVVEPEAAPVVSEAEAARIAAEEAAAWAAYESGKSTADEKPARRGGGRRGRR